MLQAPPSIQQTETAATLPAPQPRPLLLRAHLIALLGYFLLALLVTYPAARHFTTQAPGDLLADRDQNLWNLWWLREAITLHTNPFHTGLLYYPYGVSLYYHTLALPLGLIGLLPQLLFGLPAAYNTVLLAAFTLSGYGAFRLGLLLTDGGEEARGDALMQPYIRPFAAFLGGVVFAFTPYTLDALKGQLEVLSLQWMPLYAEAWIRAWRTGGGRYGLLSGVFLALAILSSLYYALYLLVFSAAYLLYQLWGKRRGMTETQRRKGAKDDAKVRKVGLVAIGGLVAPLVIAPLVAVGLTLPLLLGLAGNHSDPRLAVEATPSHRLAHSADLLSFFAPPHDHPLLGNSAGRPGVEEPPMHDYLGLGYVALAVSVLGAVVVWRMRRGRRFWVGLGAIALVLAMGPQLQVGRNVTGVPLPFALLQAIPGLDAIAKPERFVVLARLCMGVLATWGAGWLLVRLAVALRGGSMFKRALPFAAVLALLLVELPIHPRFVQPLSTPEGFRVLAAQPQAGLMELPFATQQNETAGERMLYQTTHGKPIMAGYLARSYNSPITDSCGPFWSFISARYLPVEGRDIVSPTMTSRPLDLLNFYKIGYLAVYNTHNGPNSSPLDPDEQQGFSDIVGHVSHAAPLYKDVYVGIYKVDNEPVESMQPALIVSDGWYNIEGGDAPFRWMKGDTGRVCIFSPRLLTATLTMEITPFDKGQPVLIEHVLSNNGVPLVANTNPGPVPFSEHIYYHVISTANTAVRTKDINLLPGMTEIRITTSGQPTTPQSLDPANKDSRPLTIGVRNMRLEVQGVK